jgi:hypothetical protein
VSKAYTNRIKSVFPENIHPMPIAFAWDGHLWECDVQVRLATGMDIDGYAKSSNMDEAFQKAFQRTVKSKTMYERVGYVPN